MRVIAEYISREAGWWLANLVNRWARSCPDTADLYRRVDVLGRMGRFAFKPLIEAVAENFRRAFPEWGGDRARRAARKGAWNLGRGFADLCHWAAWPELLAERLEVSGGDHLERAAATGRGVLLATGHVGAFPFAGIPLQWRGMGYGAVVKRLDDKRFEGLYESFRRDNGIVSVPSAPASEHLRTVLRLLREGGGVMYTFDLSPGEQASSEVEFMGRATAMHSGFVRIAARTGARIVPCCVLRKSDGESHRVVFHEPLEVPQKAQKDKEAAAAVLQRLAGWLEEIVRRNPSQWWGWVHQRD